jgi:hypothetical protein
MEEKRQVVFKSPDITKMQEIVINPNTRIYIPLGADPEEARSRYWNRPELRAKSKFTRKKAT